MKREYCKWFSSALGRQMEMLVFGQDGRPVIVFPTGRGRFYEFEDQGMISAIADKIDSRRVQLFCVDSIDGESWHNRDVPPRWRIARQVQYEQYVLGEVVPFARRSNRRPQLATLGCGMGGYHSVNLALRHPQVFTSCLTMSGIFDLETMGLLDGYYDNDCYFQLPMSFVPNLTDAGTLDCMRHNTYVLATGVNDPFWNESERMASVLREKAIPVRLDVWGDNGLCEWQCWQRMLRVYL